MRDPPRAPYTEPLVAADSGFVTRIDNRKLARLAKLCGAPEGPAAGVRLEVRLGDEVRAGQTLLLLHAETPGELNYARDYAQGAGSIVLIEP
jgi:thymidine phosphorylase